MENLEVPKKEFTYYLPDASGKKEVHKTSFNSLIIIGANGSGKSKLGAWIEQQDMDNVHRIGAQRNLNFQEDIPLKSYSQAENLVFYGDGNKSNSSNKAYRWGWGKYTTQLINDFDNVLAALIALKNNENDDYVSECKKAANAKREKPDPPKTAVDKLIEIWEMVFPQRKLNIKDAKFFTLFNDGDRSISYSSTQMSDGERAVLYLVAQVLSVPSDKTLIIDEPEVHLHRSIMNRLWSALEKYRPDCFFIYITHDTQFAATHRCSDKIWIKEFNGGRSWVLKKIHEEDLPEDLLFDILGSRKNVLFVEGEKNSYDTQLYTALYPNYYVIPCGSCAQVILRTRAFNKTSSLHHCKVYGLIDRDYRSDHEIEKFKEDHICTLQVAEVENLFLVKEVIQLLAGHLGQNPEEVFEKVSNYIVNRYEEQIEGQICQSIVSNLKYQLTCIDLTGANLQNQKQLLDEKLKSINYEKVKIEQETKFKKVLKEKDYDAILRVYNQKKLINSVGHFFGLDNKTYCLIVLRLLNTTKREDVLNAIKKYLPTEIPREC